MISKIGLYISCNAYLGGTFRYIFSTLIFLWSTCILLSDPISNLLDSLSLVLIHFCLPTEPTTSISFSLELSKLFKLVLQAHLRCPNQRSWNVIKITKSLIEWWRSNESYTLWCVGADTKHIFKLIILQIISVIHLKFE